MPRYPRPGARRPQPPYAAVSGLIDTALTPARAGLSPSRAVRRMAEDMRQAGQREGGLTRDDLALLGWTAEQIDKHGTAARELAQSLSGLTA
jgi:hypothetical protein